jgi:hypothetical protein
VKGLKATSSSSRFLVHIRNSVCAASLKYEWNWRHKIWNSCQGLGWQIMIGKHQYFLAQRQWVPEFLVYYYLYLFELEVQWPIIGSVLSNFVQLWYSCKFNRRIYSRQTRECSETLGDQSININKFFLL